MTDRNVNYGWVIVAAFFVIEVLVDGTRFTFGLYFVEFLDEFGMGKGTTAWVGALMIATYNLCGPVFAFIVNKVGYRMASIIGGVITTTGYVLSCFAPNVYVLYLTYGVIPGFGFGLVFLAGTVAVGRYFLEKRSLAMGIAFCGSGIGNFIITPLVAFLIEQYSWRGSLLILAGLALNCCALSALYRPHSTNIDEVAAGDSISCADNETEFPDKLETVIENGELNCLQQKEAKSVISNGTSNGHIVQQNGCAYNDQTASPLMQKRNGHLHTLEKTDIKGSHRSLTLSYISHRSINTSVISQSILGSNASFGILFDRRNRLKESTITVNSPNSITLSARHLAEESGHVFSNSVIESMFPKALVTNTNFIILMISSFCIGVPSFIPYSMLPDYARFKGASPEQSAWLLSTIGIGGTIGRIGSGWLSDMPCVHRLTLLGVCLLVLGVTTITSALVPIYEVFITYSALFGIFFGALYVVQPMVLFEYFGEEYIAEVMGVMMCVYGVAMFIGSPAAGWLFDVTNSYTVSFLVTGIFFLVSGVINYLVLCTKASRQARKTAGIELEIRAVDDEFT